MPNVLVFSGSDSQMRPMAEDMKPAEWNLMVRTPDSSEREVMEAAEKADFILVFGPGLSDPVLRTGKNLKLVQLCSAGYDGVNLQLAGELGVPVANNGGANAIPVAEFAITLMLSTLRHAVLVDQDTRAGEWKRKELDGREAWELSGKTVGIVGAGRVGSTLTGMLRGFETRTLYADPVRSEKAEGLGARRVELDELLSESDIVTLHVPLLPSTRRLIGRAELGLMKESAILINTCRGPVVDEAALYDALTSGTIWAAGLDVFEKEPVDPGNPLLTLENVVVGPHVAGQSQESYPRRIKFAFENMRRVWDGGQPESVVNID